MPIEHTWLIEGKVISIITMGDVTLDDLKLSAKLTSGILDTSDTTVHLIVNLAQTYEFASDISEINVFMTPINRHPRMGWSIVYRAQNKLVRFIITLASQITRSRVRVVNTRNDAINALMKLDPALSVELESHLD